jgi:hypothetical protein
MEKPLEHALKTSSISFLCLAGAGAVAAACGGDTASPTSPLNPPVTTLSCADKHDTSKVPINDLGTGCYLSFAGGLYPAGSNTIPAAHALAGLAAAARIQPLDGNGLPSPSGKIALVSIGMSNTTQEFCSEGAQLGSCTSYSFIGQATADAAVNHTTLVLVNGAAGGRTSSEWVSATSQEYDRIRQTWLTPLGLSEKQVQIAWVKSANAQPKISLPDTAADAYALQRQLAQIARALKQRYPNLQQVYFTSRIYAGYATSMLNPEPYAYETAFGVKWVIESQIQEMATGLADARTGSLRYDNGTAPWLAWGPYPWANGMQARSDGLTWLRTDYNTSDYTHPGTPARTKIGAMLLAQFKSDPAAQCWFLAGRSCR